jgi:hypothetical protein
MDFDRPLSPSLLNKVVRSSPSFGIPLIYAINAVSIDTGGSSHSVPPWMQLRSNLTQSLISRLHLKCGTSNTFNIPDFFSPISHTFISNTISHVPDMLLVHKCFSLSHSGNFFSSMISWYTILKAIKLSSMSPSLLTIGGIDNVSINYFPSPGTLTYDALYFLGRI